MSLLDEEISRQFHAWEMRGRGGRLYERPVSLEPPFLPFFGYNLALHPADEGRRSTLLGRFWSGLTAPPPAATEELAAPEEGGPYYRDPDEYHELQLSLPDCRGFSAAAFEPFFQQVFRAGQTLTFELLGTDREIVPQFVGSAETVERIERALLQYFPGVTAVPSQDALHRQWSQTAPHVAVLELALGQEFMLPLGQPQMQVPAAIVSALDGLRQGELGLYQVLIEPTQNAWEEHVAPTLLTPEGKPVFANRPELVGGAERKLSSAFVAVVVRLTACSEQLERSWQIVRELAAPFGAFAQRGSNHFIPLSNEGYPPGGHEEDTLQRCSRRTGMLLNVEEVISLLTFPTTAVSKRLRRDTARSHLAPEELRRPGSLLLGKNLHAGREEDVWLTPEHRVRHMHVLGAPGTGKTSLLLHLIQQDIENGAGFAVLDPHGDLIESVLGLIPPERAEDVVLVDPSDEEYIVGFNILAAHSDLERNLLASDLVSVFRRLSTSWGEQMNSVLRNAILAFLESSRGGTLMDLRRFLLDRAYRQEFLTTVTDPEIVFYWQQTFPRLTGNRSIGPVLTRLDEFLSPKPIRYMVSQQKNRLNFAEILDEGRILLVKLAEGQLGRENAHLFGSVIVSKIQQTAVSRQRMPEAQRSDFWVYIDECHSFITPSMTEILTGARKYRVGLILAHQEVHQLDVDRQVAGAVLNCGTRVVFRVNDRDARELDSGFAHFQASDLQNLNNFDAICRVERSDSDFNLRVPKPTPEEPGSAANRQAAIDASRQQYGTERAVVAQALVASFADPPKPAKPLAPASLRETENTRGNSAPEAAAEPSPLLPEATQSAEPAPPLPKPAQPETEFGRGSPEHRAIQQQIRETAMKLGFHARVEDEVLNGAGAADVLLNNDYVKVACEVSMTGLLADDIANVRKCFAAGNDWVITVAPEKSRVVALAQAFATAFSSGEAERIHVCPPRGVGPLLKRILRQTSKAQSETARSGGYKVQRKYATERPDAEARKIEAEILEAIARALRGE